jgi:hypothetical protein
VKRALIASLLAAGCAGTGMGPPPGGAALSLGARDGSGALAPYKDGQAVTLVEGAQGGFHVWMDFRARGLDPSLAPSLERTATRASDGTLVLRGLPAPANLAAAPDDPDALEPPQPLPMFMCPTPIGVSVIGVPVTYKIQLSDGDTPEASAEVTLVPACPPENADFCLKICTG